MRVITGALRGRRIPAPGEGVRPTPERVREALFSILYSREEGGEGSLWLDLFCGTGSIGIEALSRGAEFVTFVDASRRNLEAIAGFLNRTGFFSSAQTIQAYLPRDLGRIPLYRGRTYDLVFADPPFTAPFSPLEILEAPPLLRLTHPGALLIWECPFRTPEFPVINWEKEEERRYGGVLLRFYRRK